MPNHYDLLVRSVFGDPAEMAGVLQTVLPSSIAEQITWSSLRLQNAHFVDAHLAEHEADLVYEARFNGEDVILYILFEHQSSNDDLMAFRLLRYMVRIWDRSLEGGAKKLPPILPVVLAHPESRWTAPVSMFELYALSPIARSVLALHLPSFTYVVDDIRNVTDEELKTRSLMTARGRLTLLLLRHGRDPAELQRKLVAWADELQAVLNGPDGPTRITPVVRFLVLVWDRSMLQALQEQLDPIVGKSVGDAMMTLAEECEARGKARGKAETLLTVLEQRFTTVSESQRTQVLTCSDLVTLERWISRVFSAKTTAEVLAES